MLIRHQRYRLCIAPQSCLAIRSSRMKWYCFETGCPATVNGKIVVLWYKFSNGQRAIGQGWWTHPCRDAVLRFQFKGLSVGFLLKNVWRSQDVWHLTQVVRVTPHFRGSCRRYSWLLKEIYPGDWRNYIHMIEVMPLMLEIPQQKLLLSGHHLCMFRHRKDES